MLDFYESKAYFSIEEGSVVDYTTQMLSKHGLKQIHKKQIIGQTLYCILVMYSVQWILLQV